MKKTNVLRLVCLNVLVIDSLRNLPIIARLGSNLLALYLLTALIFLLPVAQISRQIAKVGLRQKGGASVYQFIDMELGPRFAKAQSFLLWTYNLLWYPTLIIFLGSFLHTILKPYIGLTPLSFAATHSYLFIIHEPGSIFINPLRRASACGRNNTHDYFILLRLHQNILNAPHGNELLHTQSRALSFSFSPHCIFQLDGY